MNSQELEKLLAEWRSDTRHVEAPGHVEAALRSAFRAQAGVSARRGWQSRALAVAAAVALAVGAAAWKLVQPVAPPPALTARISPPPTMVLPAQQPTTEPPPLAKRAKRERLGITRAKVESRPPEVATDFLPIEDTATLAPIESGHILRVQLPRSTMVRFGLPVNQDRMMEPVKADVVFAQDGIARAIRFVK